jgi:hypothetical protein
MEESEFRNAVIAHLSNAGFVQSYKTQLRLALHKFSSANRDFAYPVYHHSLRSELICNIVADYLKAYHYRGTLHVFVEESAFHKIPHSDVIRQVDVADTEATILESLMAKKRRPFGGRSIACQTDGLSISERLDFVDMTARATRSEFRSAERRRMVADRLARIREEKEVELQERLRHSFEAQKTIELSRTKIEAAERVRTEMARMKAEFEAQLLARAGELRLAREQEEASARMLQQELDRQLQSLRGGGKQQTEAEEALDIEALRRKCNGRLHKLLRDAKKLVKERERVGELIHEEQVAFKRTLAHLAQVRQQFAGIQV